MRNRKGKPENGCERVTSMKAERKKMQALPPRKRPSKKANDDKYEASKGGYKH